MLWLMATVIGQIAVVLQRVHKREKRRQRFLTALMYSICMHAFSPSAEGFDLSQLVE